MTWNRLLPVFKGIVDNGPQQQPVSHLRRSSKGEHVDGSQSGVSLTQATAERATLCSECNMSVSKSCFVQKSVCIDKFTLILMEKKSFIKLAFFSRAITFILEKGVILNHLF